MISRLVTERGALAVRGADAVGAGVAAADDDDVACPSAVIWSGDLLAERGPVGRRQELHGLQWTPPSSRPGHRQVARHGRADGEDDRVVAVAQLAAR